MFKLTSRCESEDEIVKIKYSGDLNNGFAWYSGREHLSNP